MASERRRAQSAIEYLMTYGWAIIIILVVLGVLYLLGVFTPGALLGTSCAPNFKYLCLTPVLSTSGALSFLFGQNTGYPEYNLAFACTSGVNQTNGQPFANGTSPWYYVNATGVLSPVYNISSVYTLYTDGKLYVNALQCFGPSGSVLSRAPGMGFSKDTFEFADDYAMVNATPLPVGTTFSGMIWVEYTNGPGAPSNSVNPYVITQVASFTAKAGVTTTTSTSSTSTTSTSSTSTVGGLKGLGGKG